MSLAEAFKDGREFRRLLSGGYEEDLRQQREVKQAAITESRQRTQASKDRIALAQKSEDRVRRNQLMMNLYKFKILPELTEMKNRNATPKEYETYSDNLNTDYPDIVSVYGKDGIQFKKRNKQIEFDMTINMKAEDLPEFGIPENSILHESMLQKIKNGGGSASFIISGDELGKLKMGSPGLRHLETIIKDPDATPEDIQQATDIANNIFKKETDNGKEVDGENLLISTYNSLANLAKGAANLAKGFLSGSPVEQKPPQSQDSDSLPTAVKYNKNSQSVKLSTGELINVSVYEEGVDTGKYKKFAGETDVKSSKERSKVGNGV